MRPTFRLLVAIMAVAATAHASPATAQAASRPPAGPTLALVNKSSQVIEELYISSTRDSGWGDDRLGTGSIERNATFRVRLNQGCLYDLQVAYADKRTEERMRVNLCRTPSQTFTGADAHAPPAVPSHDVTLENHTSRPITSLAVADTSDQPGEEDWGDNLLGTPLLPGARITVSYEGDCQVGVRLRFANGASEQRHTADLCADPKVLTVTPGWATQDDLPPAEPAEPLSVTNRSSHRLVELYAYPDDAPADDPSRTEERLGTRVLDAGGKLPLALQRDGKCLFTLRGVFEGDVPDQVEHGIDFCPRRTVDVGTP